MLSIENLNIELEKYRFSCPTLHISKGSILVVLGTNGAGKTVFLESLAGRFKVKSGTIILNNRNITHSLPEERNIAIVYQDYCLFPFLTIEENIAFPLKHRNGIKLSKEKISDLVNKQLTLFGIESCRTQYPKTLSGGQKQRVALARALLTNPDLLLLDEPLSALDKDMREKVKPLIKAFITERQVTTIIVTHDYEEAIYFADYISYLKDGILNEAISKEDSLWK